MKIRTVQVFEIQGSYSALTGLHRQVHPLDIYPELQRERQSRGSGKKDTRTALYVEITTDADLSGLFGPIGTPAGQTPAIQRDLAPLILGQDPLRTEFLHDIMLRVDRHGRSGHFMTGISALDCALWDLKGKAWDKPVYRLLGGESRPAIPAYASMLGHSVEPAEAAETAKKTKEAGFSAQKWFFPCGPGSGEDGYRANISMATAVREAVGREYILMFDAFMGWDLPYAVRMARALEPLEPFWLEEALPPEHTEGFRRLKSSTRVPLATGEHVFGRWQTRELLTGGSIDVLQNDPDWTGGITELTKICALASSFDVPVIAHGHSLLPALHVALSQTQAVVPYVEYLLMHQESSQHFHKIKYRPREGMVYPPEAPGMGIVLDDGQIELKRVVFEVS